MSYAAEDVDMYEQSNGGGDTVIRSPPKEGARGQDGKTDSEGEGDDIRPGKGVSDDSSEEEEEDEEAERRVREGFIVDEDEEDEDEEADDEEEERRRRKRRKHKHKKKHRKHEEEEEDLDEDDLDLLEENTGGRIARSKLTRLRRGQESDDEGAGGSSRRRTIDDSDDSGIDEANIIGARPSRAVQDIQSIWDDDRVAGREDDEDMDMDDFIADEDEEEEGAGAMAEEEREERRRERRRLERERRELMKAQPELTGIDASAWDEIHEVFGDGHDYDWALVDDEEEAAMEDGKEPTKFADVFEPSEIKARLLTEDDDIVRARDMPERMQLSTSTLSPNQTVDWFEPLSAEECQDAASWITPKLGGDKEHKFFRSGGEHYALLGELVEAVTHVLEFLFINNYEVPYIFTHRRDFLLESTIKSARAELLSLDDLWNVYHLGLRYRSLCLRRRKLQKTYDNLGIHDEYFENQILKSLDSVEMVVDATQWLNLKHRGGKKVAFDVNFYGDEEQNETAKAHKKPSRNTAYDLTKDSIVSQVSDGFGIKSHEIVENFMSMRSSRVHHVISNELPPLAFAERFQDPDPSKAQSPEQILRQARMLLATELGADPILRKFVRDQFRMGAVVSCRPTEKGRNSITPSQIEYNFKYLDKKSAMEMTKGHQFLLILEAESKNVITVTISLSVEARDRIVGQIMDAFQEDSISETSQMWNGERQLVVEEALDSFFIPMGTKWLREYLRDEVEEKLSKQLYDAVMNKIDVAPYRPPQLQEEEDVPSVLAASWGKGDPKKDEINLVLLDEFGRMREHLQIDNLTDVQNEDIFRDLVRRRKPDCVVVGGYEMNTTKLRRRIREVLNPSLSNDDDGNVNMSFGQEEVDPAFQIPVIYGYDQVAKIYQHSKRAAAEFPELNVVGRFCVGIARYTQSPLNEFAALGSDCTAVLVDEPSKMLLPKEKYYAAFERALVNVVNKVGIDINRAVNEPYYAFMLPFVSGLGPRKAQALIKRIVAIGGTLVNREHFIKQNILTTSIFINAAGFLRIVQDEDYKEPKSRPGPASDFSDDPDPLDNTRVHPEDYDLARKMASDALELDEEDVVDEHPSWVISQLMKNADIERKLYELNLDDFATSLRQEREEQKRHTLNMIRSEMLKPFGELREPFIVPDARDVFWLLGNLKDEDLRPGYKLTCTVTKVLDHLAIVSLPVAGLEGSISSKLLVDEGVSIERAAQVVRRGQVLDAVVLSIRREMDTDLFQVEMSARPLDVGRDDSALREIKHDSCWDIDCENNDKEIARRKKNAENSRARRVIKHPNFHNFTSHQAEVFLEDQHPGDVVVRPSSKGADHLAVTWKVADKLYQHIDVFEPNATIGDQQTGGQLIVDQKYEYSDLDELIVNHVKTMARRVEELMAHEKYKRDEDELHKFLTSFVAANPTKSIYGFTLNRKKPGRFDLCFLARKNSPIQTWPVRVTPEAYYLFDAAAAGVSELCDAFKVRYLHESQNASMAPPKTPYGAGRMTPGRTPARTPGHMSTISAMSSMQSMSVRNPSSQTPRHFAGPSGFGGPTPSAGTPMSSFGGSTLGAPSTLGFQTPRAGAGGFTPRPGAPPGPPGPPPGMNPQRASMIQQSGGWGATGGWGR